MGKHWFNLSALLKTQHLSDKSLALVWKGHTYLSFLLTTWKHLIERELRLACFLHKIFQVLMSRENTSVWRIHIQIKNELKLPLVAGIISLYLRQQNEIKALECS